MPLITMYTEENNIANTTSAQEFINELTAKYCAGPVEL